MDVCISVRAVLLHLKVRSKYTAPHRIISRETTENFESLSMNDAGNLHSRPSTEEFFIRVSGAPRAVGIMVFGKFSWLYFGI
jgi:hypothetical protein